ncbi:MAG TPA: hypothetical protein VKC34_14165 [Blastocatellia bacterium]|nr:hypothetical protein [Blastocatellia bacterium]
MKKSFKAPLLTILLVLSLSLPAFADTIRLKDGSIIRGQIIGFKDQQFTVLVGTGTRGRRSRIQLYMEDVDSIEFDSFNASTAGGADTSSDDTSAGPSNQPSRPDPSQARTQPTAPRTYPPTTTTTPTTSSNRPSTPSSSPTFFQINTRVRGDSTTNGWTNSGLVVRRGQRLRISATGRILLGGGRVSTPSGLTAVPDNEKLMRNEATGALIAVIGDDNDNFILVGRSREFTAERDGVLFLGVNEGNLADNTGSYDAVIEAEAISNTQR